MQLNASTDLHSASSRSTSFDRMMTPSRTPRIHAQAGGEVEVGRSGKSPIWSSRARARMVPPDYGGHASLSPTTQTRTVNRGRYFYYFKGVVVIFSVFLPYVEVTLIRT